MSKVQNKHNKRTSISATGFDPASIEVFRIYALVGADSGAGSWVLCYWTVIQNCYQEKFFEFIKHFIELGVMCKPKISTRV